MGALLLSLLPILPFYLRLTLPYWQKKEWRKLSYITAMVACLLGYGVCSALMISAQGMVPPVAELLYGGFALCLFPILYLHFITLAKRKATENVKWLCFTPAIIYCVIYLITSLVPANEGVMHLIYNNRCRIAELLTVAQGIYGIYIATTERRLFGSNIKLIASVHKNITWFAMQNDLLVVCHILGYSFWSSYIEYAVLFDCAWVACICRGIYLYITEKEAIEDMMANNTQPLPSASSADKEDEEDASHNSMLEKELRHLIEEEHVYLTAGIIMDDIARRIGTNRTYLARMMHDIYGQTFTEKINSMRLQSAQEDLLRRPDASIENIAMANGFNSSNTFNKVFKAHFGCTPTAWRNSSK